MEPFALAPGDGQSVASPTGGVMTFKATSEQSGGELTAIDAISAPGEGPPLHVHPDQDEFIYVLEGLFSVKLADELLEAAPGSYVHIPRGTPHTWQNIAETPSRFFAGLMPAAPRFEEFFMRYAELPPEERGIEAFGRLAKETNAFEVLGPPLAKPNYAAGSPD